MEGPPARPPSTPVANRTRPSRRRDREAAVVALDQATSDLTEATARLQCIVEAVNNEAARDPAVRGGQGGGCESKETGGDDGAGDPDGEETKEGEGAVRVAEAPGGVRALRERHAAKVERERAERERLEEASRSNEGPEDAEEATGDSTLNAAPAPAPSPVPSPPTILASLSAEQPVAERKRKRAGPGRNLGFARVARAPNSGGCAGIAARTRYQLDKDLSEWWRENPGGDVKVAMTVDEEGELCVAICSPH